MLKNFYFNMTGRQIFSLSDQKLMERFKKARIKGLGKAVSVRDMFVYRPGSVPVLLVAHVDCVLSHPTEKDVKQYGDLIYSETGQLGGDDRAGVLAIFELLRQGYRPHVLLTNYEEVGGIGADCAAEYLKDTIKKANIRYIVELDRREDNDACFYGDTNEEFQDFITAFGFKSAHGSFSDITVLCPAWGISGVNLSIGYYNAHTDRDFVCVDNVMQTITRVKKMLELDLNSPIYEYKEREWKFSMFDRFGPVHDGDFYSTIDDYAPKIKSTRKSSKYSDPFYYRDGLSWDYEGFTDDGSIYETLRALEAENVIGTIGSKKAH